VLRKNKWRRLFANTGRGGNGHSLIATRDLKRLSPSSLTYSASCGSPSCPANWRQWLVIILVDENW